MTFFMQHGYGKGSKITDLASAGNLTGVILSPADEDQDALGPTVANADELGLRVLMDPQSYVYAVTPLGAGRFHDSHGLDLTGIHWSQDAAATASQVDSVEAANEAIGITGVKIAPSVLQSTLTDVWTPLAIQLARTASSSWGEANTLASVIIGETALADWTSVEDWLDVATTLQVRGFYFLIDRHPREYPAIAWDKTRLANLLRVIYRLSAINGYEVIWGYSDIEGLLGLAAGANSAATGWNYSLRQFALSKWQPRTPGGQPATPRMTLSRLWVPVRAEAEAKPLYNSVLRSELFESRYIRRFSESAFSSWTRREAQEQHMMRVASHAQTIASEPDVSRRVEFVVGELEDSIQNFRRIASTGIVLPPAYRSRVENFLSAIDTFAKSEAL